MTPLPYELAFGLLLGFSLTIPPGPMNVYIVSQSVRSFREGLITGFGAMCADLVLGVLVFGLHTVVDLSAGVRWVYLVGAASMAFLGATLWRSGRARSPPAPTAGLATYGKALAIGVSNPFQIVWWLTAGLAFAYLGGLVLFVGLFGAIAVWIVVFPWVVHRGTERSERTGRLAVLVSSVLILGFAAYFLFLAASA